MFFTVDNILQKLLDNDRFIKQYIEKVQNAKISKERALCAFTQDVTELKLSTYEQAFIDHMSVHHDYDLTANAAKPYKGPGGAHFMQMSDIFTYRLKTDFSNFDEEGASKTFLSTESANEVTTYMRDVVMEMECDTDSAAPTNYVAVHVCND